MSRPMGCGVQALVELCPWCTEESPPASAPGILASRSFPVGAESGGHTVRVQRAMRVDGGAECGAGWAGEVGRGADQAGHHQVFGILNRRVT